LHVQVHSEGGVGVGAGVDGAIIVIFLGDHDTLGSGELLFQVTGDDLLLVPSESSNTLARSSLVQGIACGSHGGDESLLASASVTVTAYCSSTERLEVLLSMVCKTLVVRGGAGGGWWRTLGLGQR
jgi:hypothetical protein